PKEECTRIQHAFLAFIIPSHLASPFFNYMCSHFAEGLVMTFAIFPSFLSFGFICLLFANFSLFIYILIYFFFSFFFIFSFPLYAFFSMSSSFSFFVMFFP
ncbi:YjiH family protein, partial [Staphylococcus pseudintermedius]